MNNKLLLILLVLSLSLAAFLAGYLISHTDFKGQSANLTGDSILNRFDGNSVPTEIEFPKDLVVLSKGAVISPTLSKEKNSLLYYDQTDGRVFQVSPRDLKETLVSGNLLPDLVRTVWSPNKNEVVSIFYAQDGERFKYYNYQTRKVFDFGPQVRSAVFSPDGSRLAYFKSQGLEGAIYLSAPDGDSPKKLLDTRISNLELFWPSQESLAFKTRADGVERVFILSLTGSLNKIVEGVGQLELLWSPNGEKLLYSVKNNNETTLSVKNLSTSESTSLQASVNASRCAWSIDAAYVICSVPRSGAGEDVYKIGLSGTKELIASPKKNIVVKQLILTALEDFIIMTSSLDGKLYALKNPAK